MPFLSELIIKPTLSDKWQLVKPLIYRAGESTFLVPAGFATDLASIPRPLRPLFPVHGKHTRAAVVHDWLYQGGIVDRETADAIFSLAMRESGVGWLKRKLFHGAVRLAGRFFWKLEKEV